MRPADQTARMAKASRRGTGKLADVRHQLGRHGGLAGHCAHWAAPGSLCLPAEPEHRGAGASSWPGEPGRTCMARTCPSEPPIPENRGRAEKQEPGQRRRVRSELARPHPGLHSQTAGPAAVPGEALPSLPLLQCLLEQLRAAPWGSSVLCVTTSRKGQGRAASSNSQNSGNAPKLGLCWVQAAVSQHVGHSQFQLGTEAQRL